MKRIRFYTIFYLHSFTFVLHYVLYFSTWLQFGMLKIIGLKLLQLRGKDHGSLQIFHF